MTTRHLTLTTLAACAVLLAACGKKEEAAPAPVVAPPAAAPAVVTPAPASAVPADTAASPVAQADVGKTIYSKTCALCHSAGVAGAPKSGDKADWGPRIAQGKDVLYKHAIEGFTGAKGMMPARGGNAALTDDEVKAAVDYQVSINQ